MNEKIIIPIELDVEKVKMLVSELNNIESSEMSIFIEDILRKTNDVSLKMRDVMKDIMKENPFSQKYL